MEFLLILEPIASTIWNLSMVSLIFVFFALVILFIAIHDSEKEQPLLISVFKKLKKLMFLCFAVLLISTVPRSAWDIYKNVIVYRTINSDTTEKAVDNANLLMDKLRLHIDSWYPKGVVNEVEEKVKDVVK